MGKKCDVSDFECFMEVVDLLAGLSFSEPVDLLGFSPKIISGVYRKWFGKEKIPSKQQFSGRK